MSDRAQTLSPKKCQEQSRRFLGLGTWPIKKARVAQLVEHATENRSVGGSNPPPGTTKKIYPIKSITYAAKSVPLFASGQKWDTFVPVLAFGELIHCAFCHRALPGGLGGRDGLLRDLHYKINVSILVGYDDQECLASGGKVSSHQSIEEGRSMKSVLASGFFVFCTIGLMQAPAFAKSNCAAIWEENCSGTSCDSRAERARACEAAEAQARDPYRADHGERPTRDTVGAPRTDPSIYNQVTRE